MARNRYAKALGSFDVRQLKFPTDDN
jgi:hypothetical protein